MNLKYSIEVIVALTILENAINHIHKTSLYRSSFGCLAWGQGHLLNSVEIATIKSLRNASDSVKFANSIHISNLQSLLNSTRISYCDLHPGKIISKECSCIVWFKTDG